jgi:hypothetical protein
MRFRSYYSERFPWGSLAVLGLYFSTLSYIA